MVSLGYLVQLLLGSIGQWGLRLGRIGEFLLKFFLRGAGWLSLDELV
jgi:hypothetical protein